MQSLAARLELDRTWLIMHIIHDTCSSVARYVADRYISIWS